MACDRHRAHLRAPRIGVLCLALSLLLVPWTGTAQEDSARVKVHVVKRGETLTRIAGTHGVRVEELREWNGIKGSRILVGQELRIPAELEYYRVKAGDTLAKISKEQDVPVKLIRQLNRIDGDRIYPGQGLKLQPSHADEVNHVVVAGDEDDSTLEPSLMMKRTIATCGLAMLPRSGHVLNIEEPALFNRLLEDFFHTVEAGRWTTRETGTE